MRNAREGTRWIVTKLSQLSEKLMIFIEMDNGNGPPARIEISKNKDGKLLSQWSGLSVRVAIITSRKVNNFRKVVR